MSAEQQKQWWGALLRTTSSGGAVKPLAFNTFGRMLNKPDEITGMNRIKLLLVVLIDTNV
ncbi:hypothetical protein [Humibacter ginsengisoli]